MNLLHRCGKLQLGLGTDCLPSQELMCLRDLRMYSRPPFPAGNGAIGKTVSVCTHADGEEGWLTVCHVVVFPSLLTCKYELPRPLAVFCPFLALRCCD